MPDFEVLLKTVEAQWIASVRANLPWSGQDILGPTITRMYDEVDQFLESQNVKGAGPGIALWHKSQFVHTVID